jgi:hypothetical protein
LKVAVSSGASLLLRRNSADAAASQRAVTPDDQYERAFLEAELFYDKKTELATVARVGAQLEQHQRLGAQ